MATSLFFFEVVPRLSSCLYLQWGLAVASKVAKIYRKWFQWIFCWVPWMVKIIPHILYLLLWVLNKIVIISWNCRYYVNNLDSFNKIIKTLLMILYQSMWNCAVCVQWVQCEYSKKWRWGQHHLNFEKPY